MVWTLGKQQQLSQTRLLLQKLGGFDSPGCKPWVNNDTTPPPKSPEGAKPQFALYRPFRAHFVFCICNPGLTPWAIRRLSALSVILYSAYIFVLFVLYTTHKHQYIIFTNFVFGICKPRAHTLGYKKAFSLKRNIVCRLHVCSICVIYNT